MATPKLGDPVCALRAARPTQPSIPHEAQEMASNAKWRCLREKTLPANAEKAPEDEDGAQDEDSQKLDAWLDDLLAKASPWRTTANEWRRLREEIPTTVLDTFDNLSAALSKRAASQLALPLQAASPTREAAPKRAASPKVSPKRAASPRVSPKQAAKKKATSPKQAASPEASSCPCLRCLRRRETRRRWQLSHRAAGEEHLQKATWGSIGKFADHYPPSTPAKKAIFDAIKMEFSDSKKWAKTQNILWKID